MLKNKFLLVKRFSILAALLGPFAIFLILNSVSVDSTMSTFSGDTEMRNTKVLELGGVVVSIPEGYRNFLSFKERIEGSEGNGDELARKSYPQVSSFGFVVVYPDMQDPQPVSGIKVDIFTTKRMRVLVNAGSKSGLDGSLGLRKKRLLDPKKPCYMKCFLYDPMEEGIYGLTGYASRIVGEKVDGYRAGSDMRDFNIYLDEGSESAPKTFIQCSNNTHAAARCSHMFTLTPKMNVSVKVGYRKSLLPYWREIQEGISDLIYGFEI
ncbi:hypothetical protein Mag101_05645 [Microbulbifer agarilyticus]|uniref:Uncharacterized protein n=1 Tax=Microbulbifer agarilyticus TaxID=260552 RepID=A0A1Q2M4J3_9GAMM|nr:hypothetical protein [Microbulbifer agarilyticus]AQQ67177.1 hypothetical protein Mag101_05645 [Microbulbifer agarilyticus]